MVSSPHRRVFLRFLFRSALADELAAAGAAGSVFLVEGVGEIDIGDVGESHEPGEDVGKFEGEVLLVVSAQRGGEFADFFHEPHKGSVDAALRVLAAVHGIDELLNFRELHVRWFLG